MLGETGQDVSINFHYFKNTKQTQIVTKIARYFGMKTEINGTEEALLF